MTEHQLQVAVARYLDVALRAPTWWTSIDHGAGKMARASAGLRKARGVKAGVPDILVFHPTGHHASGVMRITRVIGIELKAERGELSKAQWGVRDALEETGVSYYIARSVDDVEAILRPLGIPLHASLGVRTAA